MNCSFNFNRYELLILFYESITLRITKQQMIIKIIMKFWSSKYRYKILIYALKLNKKNYCISIFNSYLLKLGSILSKVDKTVLMICDI